MPWPGSSSSRPTTRSSGATGSGWRRDAERERLILEWDLGYEESESS